MRQLLYAAVTAAVLLVYPLNAVAHDDPIVTVRVLTNGFNVLDMDAVMGELSDSATLNVERSVSGGAQIRAWVKEQMDSDLRIEIVDIGTPEKLSDGYTLKWTARLSRQDWRKAGLGTRLSTNSVTIHNGRITEWTAAFDSAATSSSVASASQSVGATVQTSGGMPEVLGVPITLLLAAAVALGGATFVFRGALRR